MITWEQLKKINENLGTIEIEKKDKNGKTKVTPYVMAKDRVLAFRELCPNGTIETELLSAANGNFITRTVVKDEDGTILGTGLAQENESQGFINKSGSALENAETSSTARALGFAGVGVDGSLASAEEVANAIMNQGAHEIPPTTAEKAFLSAFCKLAELDINAELKAVGWSKGAQLTRIEYNKIIANLVSKSQN